MALLVKCREATIRGWAEQHFGTAAAGALLAGRTTAPDLALGIFTGGGGSSGFIMDVARHGSGNSGGTAAFAGSDPVQRWSCRNQWDGCCAAAGGGIGGRSSSGPGDWSPVQQLIINCKTRSAGIDPWLIHSITGLISSRHLTRQVQTQAMDLDVAAI